MKAMEKNTQSTVVEKAKVASGSEEIYPYCSPAREAEYPVQVNQSEVGIKMEAGILRNKGMLLRWITQTSGGLMPNLNLN